MSLKNFEKEHLLTCKQFKKLIRSDSPNDKAEVIANHLKKYAFVITTSKDEKNCNVYTLQSNLTWHEGGKTHLENCVTDYIRKSAQALNSDDREELIDDCGKKNYSDCFKNSHVAGYWSQLIVALQNNKVNFLNPTQIHFENGYIDIADEGKFKKRTIGGHFVISQKIIQRDWTPSTPEAEAHITNFFKKTYPNSDDWQCNLTLLGAATIGQGHTLKAMVFMLGTGDSGKSTIMELCKKALDSYVLKLGSGTFSKEKQDKTLNQIGDNLHCLLIWVNEMDSKRVNEAAWKELCEAKFSTERLYKDGEEDYQGFFLMIATSNEVPNIPNQTSTYNRIIAEYMGSKFVGEEDAHLYNPEKHIYMKDQEAKEALLNTPEYLNTWINMLVKEGLKWKQDRKIIFSQNFKETKEMVASGNDDVQAFIDMHIERVTDTKARVSKMHLFQAWSNFMKAQQKPTRKSEQQLMTNLKDKGFDYESTLGITIAFKTQVKGGIRMIRLKNVNLEGLQQVEEECATEEELKKWKNPSSEGSKEWHNNQAWFHTQWARLLNKEKQINYFAKEKEDEKEDALEEK
ncbi:MAG: hypothetical protein P4L31_06020, partial [Candidatus Babeliales bacterium]|nr:hypothetical protein [Candidatus Babeliales bacterium]